MVPVSPYPDYQPIFLESSLSLAELEANVSRIDAEIAKLQAERFEVYNNWRRSKASIAPITYLPIEIIRQIFFQCGGAVALGDYCWKQVPSPLCLLQVCRAWYRIADSMEGLWTKILLDSGNEEELPILRTSLRRSGRLPLDITLNVSLDYRRQQKQVKMEALTLILQHLHRWRNINISWHGEDFNPSFIPTPSNGIESFSLNADSSDREVAYHAPMLEVLHLDTNVIDDPTQDLQVAADLKLITSNAPRLTSFSWETQKCYEIEETLDLHLPWAQLVDLNLTCFLSVTQCIGILQECKRVERCYFLLVRLESEPNSQASVPTALDNLQFLQVNSHLPLDEFFDSFTFSALHYIVIDNGPNEFEEDREFEIPEWTQASFLDLLQRSDAPLKTLSLKVTMSEADLLECLTCVGPTIQNLDIRTPNCVPFVSNATFQLLSHHLSAEVVTCICPKLNRIDFGIHVVLPLTNDVLINLAESRWNDRGHLSHRQACSSELTSISLGVEQGVIPPADIRKLAALKKAGMPISSVYHLDLFAS